MPELSKIIKVGKIDEEISTPLMNYLILINAITQLPNLNATGMILLMVNWGLYSRNLKTHKQFEYENLAKIYSRDGKQD